MVSNHLSPAYYPISHPSAILVHGIQGKQPADHVAWYLHRGYHVYDFTTGRPLAYRPDGTLCLVEYPLGYNVRTRPPAWNPVRYDLGVWRDAFNAQCRDMEDVAKMWGQAGIVDPAAPTVKLHGWRKEKGARGEAHNALDIETADPETLEPAEVYCRDYLANLTDARYAVAMNEPPRTEGVKTMNAQMRGEILQRLIAESEGRSCSGKESDLSASVPAERSAMEASPPREWRRRSG